MTPRQWLVASAIALAGLLLAGRIVADLYTSYAWYESLGATAVWRARVGTVAALRIAAWIAASLFALGHIFTVRQSVVSLIVQRQVGDLEIGESVHGRYLTSAAIGLSLLVGGVLALSQGDWETAFLAGNGAAFGESEQTFGADLGFYVFWLPFETQLWLWTLIVVLVTTAVVIGLYVVTSGARFDQGRLRLSSHARRHLTVIGGLLLLMLAWRFRLEMYYVLFEGTGPDGAFGYVDQRVGIPGSLALALATLGAGVFVMIVGSGNPRLALWATGGVAALWLLVRHVAPGVVAHGAREIAPSTRELPFQTTRAGFTRRAYGLDRIVIDDPALRYASTDAAVAAMILWDETSLRLGIDPSNPPDSATSWITWRPGPSGVSGEVLRASTDQRSGRDSWSITAVNASAAGVDGELVQPGAGARLEPHVGDKLLRLPLIHPGASSYQILDDADQRVIGVSIGSRLARIAHAWSLQSPQFVAGPLPGPTPTLVDVRDLRARIDRLAPFFEQGRQVTPIAIGDTLYWAVDLYAASDWYPLSMGIRIGDRHWRYFQHAAVAIADAHSGDIMLIANDVLDPLSAVWVRRFENVFTSSAALPPGLRALLPPATDQLVAQAAAFGRHGSRTAGADIGHTPAVFRDDSTALGDPAMMMTPDQQAIVAVLPLVDTTGRIRGVMMGVGGSDRRTAWQATSDAPRWSEAGRRLAALDSGSGRRGQQLLRAVARVVPVGDRAVVLSPVMSVTAGEGPRLSHLGIAAPDSTWRIAGPRRDPLHPGPGDLRSEVQAVYAAIRQALQRGDWTAFGQAMETLSRLAGAPPEGR